MAQNKAWKKTGKYKKRAESLKSDKIFYIFCEGEKTEPNYFRAFRLSKAKVFAFGEGRSCVSLVSWAEKEVNSKGYLNDNKNVLAEEKDEVWCVFDRDSFGPKEFDNAIHKAEKLGYKLAYSNESFELWYLLHFEYLNTALNRKQYEKKLNTYFLNEFNFGYKKNSIDTYDRLLSKQNNAIKYAKKLLVDVDNGSFHKNNPTTRVHELVEKLNNYLQ